MHGREIGRWEAVAAGGVLLVVGWLVIAWALRNGYHAPGVEYTGIPSCAGRAMSPGETCVTSGRTWSDWKTYEEILTHDTAYAKSDAWRNSELVGAFGAVLVFAGAAIAGFRGEFERRANTGIFLTTALVPMLGVTATVAWLQLRVQDASSAPVGLLGAYWHRGVPYSAIVTGAVVVVAGLVHLGASAEGQGRAPVPQRRPEATGAAER
ncbi:hypothetical protein ABZ896_28000 [Streptomyces sp. NPDC047072]|uniref:hypothetical protein n=1 Tax=Streptomyces sp. NPDC047072 TaxID=3154809 RepID=UPI00340B24A2